MIIVGVDSVQATLPCGYDRPPQSLLRDCLPPLLQYLEHLVEVIRWWVVGSRSLPQNISEMFYGTEIRRTCWPVHPGGSLLLQDIVNDTCRMGSGVVVLQYGALTHGLQCRQNEGLQNIFSAAKCWSNSLGHGAVFCGSAQSHPTM